MNEADENLDLVNDQDQVIGSISRGDIKELFKGTGRYVRYANCFLQNDEGKLWVPRRTAHKTIAPNGLDFSASEHVQAGEKYIEAVTRGLQEELNIHIGAEDLKAIGKLTPDASRPYFSSIYVLPYNKAPNFNEEDFTGYEWLTADELNAKLESGEVSKTDLKPTLQLLRNFKS